MASIPLNSNVASLDARRRLGESTASLSKSFERLSSGLRINRPSDDAAGLSIASLLDADARVLNQGVRNVNDGISLLNIADGAMSELSNIVVHLRELASEAANGTLSGKQRIALDKEAQGLSKEFNRIARTTSFNGINLFDGTANDTTLQAGYGQLTSNLGGAIGDGTFGARRAFTTGTGPDGIAVGDFNGDGVSDIVTADYNVGAGGSVSVLLGKGDGTFGSRQSFATGSGPIKVAVADFNGDGISDIVTADIGSGAGTTVSVLLGKGDGTFGARRAFTAGAGPDGIAVGDFNGDGVSDIVTTNFFASTVSVLLGNGDGTFGANQTFAVGSTPAAVAVADFNGDGVSDLVTTDYGGGAGTTVSVLLGKGDGTFGARRAFTTGTGPDDIAVSDFNGDGVSDIVTTNFSANTVSVLLGNGDGTFGANQTFAVGSGPSSVAVGDFNGDGMLDIVSADIGGSTLSVLLGKGDGTFGARRAFTTGAGPDGIAVGDFNGDGVSDLVTTDYGGGAGTTVSVLLANTEYGVGALLPFSLATRDGARSAMTYLGQEQVRLSAQRGQVGSFQSRARYVVDALSTAAEGTRAAESRITDADVAEESASLVKDRILQQAGAAVLASANEQASLVLTLLSAAGGRG